MRSGVRIDRRPLHQRIAEVIATDALEVGEAFPSTSALAERFGVSRPTVTKALDKLEAAGVLVGGGQGKCGPSAPGPHGAAGISGCGHARSPRWCQLPRRPIPCRSHIRRRSEGPGL
ncbi:GntR family transcriptional regulator [Streptomyces sp. NPDC006706]|uniref:GntR family transcriptional regulator n=1 Tax=Streptomyces sp. NPDC006706 TaxID=3364761 RepID=UPI0036BFE31F